MAKHLEKNALLSRLKQEKTFTDRIWKANLLITMVILNDKFDFDDKDLNEFVDSYHDVLEYYNESDRYQELLEEWNQYFWEYAGVKVIDAIKRPITGKPKYPTVTHEKPQEGGSDDNTECQALT